MFQPLLDAFVESTKLPPPPHKKPLNLDLQWYRDLNDFKGWFFYDIFQHQYNVSFDKKADCDCLLGVHHRTLEELYQALTNPKKRLVFMGENERIDFNVYDFAMSFDHYGVWRSLFARASLLPVSPLVLAYYHSCI